jgi:propionate CoA-transferase
VDLQRDILDRMEFAPLMRQPPALMDRAHFRTEPMGLRPACWKCRWSSASATTRAERVLRQFRGPVGTQQRRHRPHPAAVESRLAPIGHKVAAIVNYDRFSIAPELIDDYTAMVKGIMDRYYTDVTRYTSSTFLRARLGESFGKRVADPQIFGSRDEAQQR